MKDENWSSLYRCSSWSLVKWSISEAVCCPWSVLETCKALPYPLGFFFQFLGFLCNFQQVLQVCKAFLCWLIWIFPSIYMVNIGAIQEWTDRARVWSSISWWTKTERREYPHNYPGCSNGSFQVVGLDCCCNHSHVIQSSLLHYSQVEGENFTIVPKALHQENSASSWEEAIIQEEAIISFKEAPNSQFVVFSRGS